MVIYNGKTEYLVVCKFYDETEVFYGKKNATSIFEYLNMHDVVGEYYEYYKVFDWNEKEMQFEELQLFGTWHDFDRPLYIKVCDKEGNVLFDGYGDDH